MNYVILCLFRVRWSRFFYLYTIDTPMKPRFFLSTKFVCQNIRIVFSTDSVPRYDISRPSVVPEIFFLSRHVLLSEEFSRGAFGSGFGRKKNSAFHRFYCVSGGWCTVVCKYLSYTRTALSNCLPSFRISNPYTVRSSSLSLLLFGILPTPVTNPTAFNFDYVAIRILQSRPHN